MSLSSIITSVGAAVKTLIPLAEDAAGILDPAAVPLISKAVTILTGVVAQEPTAVAVYTKIASGQPYTDAEIDADMAAYQADYQIEVAEAEAKGATLPPAT